MGTQIVDGQLILNNVSAVTSANLPVTSVRKIFYVHSEGREANFTQGIVHVIDRILDPSAQIFESDVAKTSQSFIAGSCSNPLLPYC